MKLSQWLNKKGRTEENRMIDIVRKSEWFDERWYVSKYPDVFKKLKDPARHYYQKGWMENRNPSKNFSTSAYLRRYPECNICPLVFEHNRNDYVDLSICAIMKNEAPYIKEWIDYHRLAGVKRFYIYDNESEDNIKQVLSPYIEKGIVVYKYYPGEARQIPAYEECIKEYKHKNEWIAFIDADEFIMPVCKDNIPEFLADYKDAPAVVIDWIYYDSSNHKTKPRGGLLENYVRVQYDPQIQSTHRIKSIVHPTEVVKVVDPHCCTYKNKRNAVDECHREVSSSYTDTVSVQKIRINHYYCKSMEEYRNKIERGRATQKKSVKRKFSIRDCLYDDYKYDYTAFRYVIKLKPEIALQEFFHYIFIWMKNIFIKIKHPFSKHSVYKYFDEKWYVNKYSDVKKSGLSAIDHYNIIGWKKGYNPNRNFDTVSYLEKYPNATKEGATPLYHFLRYGRYKDEENDSENENSGTSKFRKLVADSEYFDENWYVKRYPEVNDNSIDPVEHYLTVGWKQGYNPSTKFDGNAYLENYPDVKKAEMNPLVHYLKYGQNGKREVFSQPTLWDSIFNPYKNKHLRYRIVAQSKYFNKKWYLKQYPDVKKSGMDPIEHYLTVGWKQGYNPSTKFDGNAYLEHYQDVKKAGMNPLVHYLQYGQNGKREVFAEPTLLDNLFNSNKCKSSDYRIIRQSEYFNKKWYLKQYSDVKKSGLDPIEHYLTIGWKRGYNPSLKFDGNAYLDDYQDVTEADKNPLLHYLMYGKDENRKHKEVNFNVVCFPSNCKKYVYETKATKQNPKRVAIFASFSADGKIDDYVVYYLKALNKICDAIIFIADNPVEPKEADKIKKYVTYAKFERHDKHCFGSYQQGYFYALDNGLLNMAEELVFCNDSFCGPVYQFKKLFDEMDARKVDFWSLLSDNRKEYGLDKGFLVFKNKVFNTKVFTEFWDYIEKPVNVKQFANKYETILMQTLTDNGFVYDSYIKFTNDKAQYPYMFDDNPVYFPLWLLKRGCPLVKVKTLYKGGVSLESVNKVISYIRGKNTELGSIIGVYKQYPAKIKFSIIMPTYNRKDIISASIDSILNQTYNNFELIIVDDGSVDDTYSFVKNKYAKELKKGKIKYYYKENEGVCKARNYGLSKVNNDWVTYVDSDNMVYPIFLETFALAIKENPDIKTFYADLRRLSNGKYVSRDFDFSQMIVSNFIDLGVFCHHKSVYDELGGFDENIKRLVDWELIIRYTKEYTPYHISKSVMLYNDVDDHSRISNSLNYRNYFNYVRRKHSQYPVITTMITTYNHQDYIVDAIESAIKQTGHFIHEIIISDDGSTDNTPKIIAEYAEQYPYLIRNISGGKNVGISANMKKCFEAATGKYIAILEGDDYWTDSQKLEKQMQFLEANDDCAMVFSRVKVYNEDTKHTFLLDRHDNLPDKLTGKHFLKEMSLIVNFSCTMYRKEYLQNMPEVLYEGRLSEIALALYLENKGKIGFISTPLSVYRQNSGGVWSGSDKKKQLQQGLISRQTALKVCADKYKSGLRKIIDEQYIKPLKEIDEQQIEKAM